MYSPLLLELTKFLLTRGFTRFQVLDRSSLRSYISTSWLEAILKLLVVGTVLEMEKELKAVVVVLEVVIFKVSDHISGCCHEFGLVSVMLRS